MTAPNQEQSAFWEELAPGWLAAERQTELVAGPFGAAAMGRLDLQPGQRVVDIGCGSGSTTLALAQLVGSGGEAVGIDIAPAMVRAAKDLAAGAAVPNVTFVVADPQAEPLADAAFDAAYSRFGVMFFADPSAAFSNIRASLRSGGRLGFSCWSNVFANEWMFVPASALVTVTGSLPPMPGPGEPGPFSLEDADALVSLLTNAGFTNVEVTPESRTIVIPGDQLESLVAMTSRVGPVREALRTVDADTSTQIREAVRTAMFELVEDDELRLGAAALVVTAHA